MGFSFLNYIQKRRWPFFKGKQHWCIAFRNGVLDNPGLQFLVDFGVHYIPCIRAGPTRWSLEMFDVRFEIKLQFRGLDLDKLDAPY